MHMNNTPYKSDLVLIGGGHAHVHVLRMLGMPKYRRLVQDHGIRVTLIACDIHTPYSGMLPGFVAGHYTLDDIHLDLNKLCRFANVNLLHTAACRIEQNVNITHTQGGGGYVYCQDKRPPIRFDALSIDIGSAPSGTPPRYVTPVKPIAHFCAQFQRLQERIVAAHQTPAGAKLYSETYDNSTRENSGVFILLVVGGGAGGVELALAAQYNLQRMILERTAQRDNQSPSLRLQVVLATQGKTLLESHNRGVQRILERTLRERNIEVRYEAQAVDVEPCSGNSGPNGRRQDGDLDSTRKVLILSKQSKPQSPIIFDECLWCTSAGAPAWLAEKTPFATTNDGFLLVNDTYECVDAPGIFAAGDCCHMAQHPRPKAGIFAVRAGPYLLDNLLRYFTGRSLRRHRPQRQFLGLISTGDRNAVASRGQWLALQGRIWWKWKDHIDRKWMKQYKDLPDIEKMMGKGSSWWSVGRPRRRSLHANTANTSDSLSMRCGGCGAKVGATTLSRVLDALYQRQIERAAACNQSLPAPSPIHHDDAAILPIPPGSQAVLHTIDYFRSFVSDPYVFGKIAALHALSDLHAMGISTRQQTHSTHTALALAVVPYAENEHITESTLMQALSGASDVLQDDHVSINGGHTCEGAELALGFCLHGFTSSRESLWNKQGAKLGDRLILTKPLGTGALFAADMRAKCNGWHVVEALESMLLSNGGAVHTTLELDRRSSHAPMIHACTDVTGFGLIGHLLEVVGGDNATSRSYIGARLNLRSIRFLQGALEASSRGIYSSLHNANTNNAQRFICNHTDVSQACPIEYPLLFDPQTSGGLLMVVDSSVASDLVDRLQPLYPYAAVIGEIVGTDDTSGGRIRIDY